MANKLMTFDQYITNPMGKNNAVLSGVMRETMRNIYKAKFDNVLLRENGKINYHLFKDSKHNQYYILINIPSEVVPNFYYDVVIKFFTNDKLVKDVGRNLSSYCVQFFSNDPSFVFTYAHVFIENGLFINELAPKMSKNALRLKPKEKNAKEEIGYVKSIYFAYLYMKSKGLFSTALYDSVAEFNAKTLFNMIEPADSKINKRIEEGKKIELKNKKEKEKEKEETKKPKTIFDNEIKSHISKVSNVKSIGSIKSIGSSSKHIIKKVKKI